MKQQAVHTTSDAILTILAKTYGQLTTALHYETPFQLLAATMLSAQCTDTRVNAITKELFRHFPDPAAMAEAEVAQIEALIRSAGLWRAKARHLKQAAVKLVQEHGGFVPAERTALERLPGVGRKTASVVLANAFRIPALAVDTHVLRVANRLGLAHSSDPLQVEAQLTAVIPQQAWIAAHHWLIYHGRQVCQARRPKCVSCPLQSYCAFRQSEGVLAAESHSK